MNSIKVFAGGLALTLALTGCSKDDPTYAPPKNQNKPGTEEPVPPAGEDIPAGAVEKTVKLNLGEIHQTIAGFGASDCWQVAWVGKHWTGKRQALCDLLFSQNTSGARPAGIGLSMWRVNLGAGSHEQGDASGIETVTRRAESYRSGTDGYDWNKCEGQRYFMEQAKNAGIEKMVLFSNSPLVQYTFNGQARSDRGAGISNLKAEHYDDFAGYLADVALHFRSEGYPVSHISPVNEPQYGWEGHDQEGSGWSNSEQARLIRSLDAALTAKGVDVDILPGEAAAWDYLYNSHKVLNAFYGTGNASTGLGGLDHVKNLVGAHSYWTDVEWNDMRDVRRKVADEAARYGTEVWQTEWSMLNNDDSYGNGFPGFEAASEMDNALYMSRVIHNDLTVAGVTSWSYWTSMDVPHWGHKNRFVLIKLTPSGGEWGDITAGDGTFEATPNLWVLGNYSLFVRPGYKRVGMELSEDASFFGSSYVSPDGMTVVSVYSNISDKTLYLSDTFDKRSDVKNIKTYTSSASKQLNASNISLTGHVILEPQSVTTVVYRF